MKNAVMISVRDLKSWGCTFFTPLTAKHPTYVYYKSSNATNSHSRRDDTLFNRTAPFRSSFLEDDSFSSSMEEDGDSSDRESDVFDPDMDYGMSLLSEGKCLLSRSRTISEKSSMSVSQKDASLRREKQVSVKKTAAEILAKRETPVKAGSYKHRSKKPSLTRQKKLTDSTDNLGSSATRSMPNTPMVERAIVHQGNNDKESSLKQSKVDSKQSDGAQQQVTFAPSPEKKSLLEKSSSQQDLSSLAVTDQASMKRAMSSESNLYKSAESDFRSTTSLSSSDFYSAESDVSEGKPSASTTESSPVKSVIESVVSANTSPKSPTSLLRPGTLRLENERIDVPSVTSSDSRIGSSKSPMSEISGSGTPVSGGVPISQTGAFLLGYREQPSSLICYESYLTKLKLNVPEVSKKTSKTKKLDTIDDDFEFEDSFENKYSLPSFELIQDGIHPSVMVDRKGRSSSELGVRSRSSHRELSFTDLDSTGSSTSIALHLKVPSIYLYGLPDKLTVDNLMNIIIN